MKNGYVYQGDFLITKTDKRYKKFQKFKAKTGISPDELWNIDCSLAKFMLPRLKLFIKNTNTFPDSSFETGDDWVKALKEMVWLFKQIEKCKHMSSLNEKEQSRFDNAKKLFCDNLNNLWT